MAAVDDAKSPVVSTRVDSPHALGAESDLPDAHELAFIQVSGIVGESLEDPPSLRLQRQAEQLAAHLRRQLASLDHREGEVNARVAGIESEVRSARLWLAERLEQCEQRKADLDLRERELDSRALDLQATEQRLERQRQVAIAASAAAQESAAARKPKNAEAGSESASAQQRRLDEAEDALAVGRAQLAKERLELARERDVLRQQFDADQARLAEDRRDFGREVDAKQAALKRRGEDLASRSEALKNLREELRAAQRETLEMRLATEELWARLQGAMTPPALVQSISQSRLQLAEHYRVVLREIVEEKAELATFGGRISQQLDKLQQQKSELDQWSRTREREIADAAGRLAAQQKQLERELVGSKKAERKWQDERRQFEKEIRRLTRQLEGRSAAA